MESGLDAGFAVAAIGCDGARDAVGALVDAADSRFQLGCVGRVAFFDGVVEDGAVGVVDDLGL
ncbi:hypothetical protein Vau01_122960 [Virgisporangium aurantiacum]|uniref:Uncharacterized protein n=1 Tax=Virgisporangium aurantiacum TaxID=175570 RepID=A0A8J4E758_9ACTN|nr:hypothetical protein Vau01_122960 [Virgisporangium aurantiacum]